MRALRVDLPLLLWAMSYHLPELVDDELVKFERTAFLSSSELPSLLRVWHKPPRSHGRGVRSKGAAKALDHFAFERVATTARREMSAVGAYMSSKVTKMSTEALLSISLTEMQKHVKDRAPTVWSLLRHCSWTSRQEKQNKLKNPDAVRPPHESITKYHTDRTRSCGTSAKAFDTLSALGITMSQAWTYRAIEQISEGEHKSLEQDLKIFPWFGSHDNVNFRFRVFEQRSDHHSHFDSGTACTIFIVKDPLAIRPSTTALRDHRAKIGNRHPLITAADVFRLDSQAAPRLAARAHDTILRILLEAPAFGFESYTYKEDHSLRPASRPGQLLVNEVSHVRQYLLDTVHMEEASYDGNERVMHEWLRQLKLDSLEEQKRTANERVLPWVGDQLTVSRLRGLLQFHRDDYNSFERLDWLIPNFGWFHLMFAFEQSLHAQYYGTRTGLGLVHAFEVLDRRGLHTTSTQGTFHHTFEEAVDHTLEAHVRALWCVVGEVESLGNLRDCAPEELHTLATRILDDHASMLALSKLHATHAGMDQKPIDPLHRQVIQFVRDVLDYRVLRDAIACGDIQTMEDMLPRLLFRFSGGQNHNYALEVCELLQNLHSEWPDDLKLFVRRYCWLTNTNGHQGSFIPVDRAKEHNIGDIKSSYAAMGPFATWEYLGKTSASIPGQRRVKDHVEHEINHGYRGKTHTSPQKENDIAKLQAVYQNAHAHTALASRHRLDAQDRFPDVVKKG
ncbi:hypothetical protein C8Q79DRAFT_1099102, partial [Trametes meyenii]